MQSYILTYYRLRKREPLIAMESHQEGGHLLFLHLQYPTTGDLGLRGWRFEYMLSIPSVTSNSKTLFSHLLKSQGGGWLSVYSITISHLDEMEKQNEVPSAASVRIFKKPTAAGKQSLAKFC